MGTPMLRAYMHGFFVDNRLYEKAKVSCFPAMMANAPCRPPPFFKPSHSSLQVLTDPFAYETYRQQRVQKKIEEERKSRISLVKKLPKVKRKP